MKEYGSQKNDQERTPMLRDWYKQQEGKPPALHLVTTIFEPGKGKNYGLLTESNFRVNVYPSSPLYSFFQDGLQQELTADASLFVRIDDGTKGQWTLVSEESTVCSWEAKDWGWKVVETRPRPATRQNQRGKVPASIQGKVE